jgi:surfactin synthase thioesterase subunit
VTLQVATLPGRESRRAQPRHVGADSWVHALADELDGQLNRPHVLLGHSMGALLAYSRSQQRISRGLRLPEAVMPDPALVTAIARVAAAATFQGSGIR